MNQAKPKRSHNNGNANKTPRHTGPKTRTIDLRDKGSHTDPLIELTVEALKRFYKTVDMLRLGNYKTGFNTYQYGMVIVEGFTRYQPGPLGITKLAGTLFGLMKADDFARLATSKAEPALADYEQALFIPEAGGVFMDGNDTKIAMTKFRSKGDSNDITVSYRNIEQFSSIVIEELFALDILPQFQKDLSNVVAKQQARNEPREAKPVPRQPRTEQRPPPRKTAEPFTATA